jgi:hypothetical protein
MIKRGLIGVFGIGLLSVSACITYETPVDEDEDEQFGGGGSGGSGGSGSGGTGGVVTGTGTKEPGEACDETRECVPGSICFNEFCVGSGTLRISLAFEIDTDLDLHVETPLGSEIYYGNRSADGGTLDVDQCVSSCGTGSHVENVVFDDNAPPGNYTVHVRNFNGRAGGAFTVEVAGTVNRSFSGTLPASDSEDFTFAVGGGSNNGGSGGSGSGGSGSGGSSNGGSAGTGPDVDCEAPCPSEFPSDTQLDVFCRMACCHTVTGDPQAAASTCAAGSELGTASCNFCN